MIPDKLADKNDWRHWAGTFVDSLEETQPQVAQQLQQGQHHEVITQVFRSEADRKLATAVYKVMKRRTKEADG